MRVGVIVAARGPAPFLTEALDSALAQERAPERVVVVDHASHAPLDVPDGVEKLRVEDAGGGPARPRDAGLSALSDCDWIALLDADDVWEPGKLAAQVTALEHGAPGGDAGSIAPRGDERGVAVCFGRAQVIDAAGRATGERLPELPPGAHRAADLRAQLYERNAIPASSVLICREALAAVGGFEPSRPLPAATDWDLWLRLVEAGFGFLCEPGARVRYRRHDDGLTADLSRLAQAGLCVHAHFAALVTPDVARSARARDLETLARGHIRERRYADARAALAEAAALDPPAPRERALRAAVAIPGVRAALGRRAPYR